MMLFLFLLLGLIEVVIGTFYGRVRIYAYEASMQIHLQLSSSEELFVLQKYLSIFKDQWSVVSWFGFFTILLGLINYFLLGLCQRQKGDGKSQGLINKDTPE